MDASLFSKLQAGHVASAHVVGTALVPKSGVTSNLRNVAGAATAATTKTANPAATTGGSTGTSSSTAAGSTITASDFLTLLVSELKNQDPTQPTDPNQYITQLAQVNSLEQLISINSGITKLDSAVTPPTTAGTGTGSGSGTGGSAGPTTPTPGA